MSYVTLCVSVLAGGALIGVGAAVVRKAHPTSGYLFIGAGALILLTHCCCMGAGSDALRENVADPEALSLLTMVSIVGGAAQVVIVAILVAVALVMLAKRVAEPSGDSGST